MANLHVTRPRPDVVLITLDRPDKLNALSYGLVEDLHRTLDEVKADNDCRVVVLTGAGRGFCSGLDLTEPFPEEAKDGLEFPRSSMRWQERIAELTTKLVHLRQPVIAAVNGPAYGGGFALALASDIRIASADARFCTQFIKLGLGGLRHRRELHVAAHRRRGTGVRPDPHRPHRGRAGGPAPRSRLAHLGGCGARRRARHRRDALRLRQVRRGCQPSRCCGRTWRRRVSTAALQVENRSQILASTSGELREAAAAFANRKKG
jgi:enoyl-CoA hydratase